MSQRGRNGRKLRVGIGERSMHSSRSKRWRKLMALGSCARGASPALALLIAGLTLPALPARAGTAGVNGVTGAGGSAGADGVNPGDSGTAGGQAGNGTSGGVGGAGAGL